MTNRLYPQNSTNIWTSLIKNELVDSQTNNPGISKLK